MFADSHSAGSTILNDSEFLGCEHFCRLKSESGRDTCNKYHYLESVWIYVEKTLLGHVIKI